MILFICLGGCMEFLLTWVIHRFNETGGHAQLLSGKKKKKRLDTGSIKQVGIVHISKWGFKHQPSRNL